MKRDRPQDDPGRTRRRRRLYEEPAPETATSDALPASAEPSRDAWTPASAGADVLATPIADDTRAMSDRAAAVASLPTPADTGPRAAQSYAADAAGPPHLAVDVSAVTAVPAPVASDAVGKEAEAIRVVRRYVGWAATLSLVPVPGLNVAAVLAVQLAMLRELAALYRVPFSTQRGKALIATLGGGLGGMAIGTPLLVPVLGAVLPLAWPMLVAASSTASASAATYAIGRVFTQHFELGGTLLDFRAADTRAFVEAQVRDARAR